MTKFPAIRPFAAAVFSVRKRSLFSGRAAYHVQDTPRYSESTSYIVNVLIYDSLLPEQTGMSIVHITEQLSPHSLWRRKCGTPFCHDYIVQEAVVNEL
jgi:hypothetical protein